MCVVLKAILWDFDGTICDTYPEIARAINQALAHFGASTHLERIIELAAVSLDSCIQTLAQDHALSYEALGAAFTDAYPTVRLTKQAPFPGFRDLCEQCTQFGVQHFIITHRRQQSLFALLEAHTIMPFFTHIIAVDAGFAKKPAPDALIHILETYGIDATDALVIGDRDFDILAGQAAGIPTALFRASFVGVHPTYAFSSYAELATIIKPLLRPTSRFR